MVPVLINSTQIPQLLQKLEDLGDKCLRVRSFIVLEKQYPFELFQIWVDVWPEFTTILLKLKLPESQTYSYYIFSSCTENLKSLLQNTDIMEWDNAIFPAYPSEFRQMIEDIANKSGFSSKHTSINFVVYKFNKSKLEQRPVPEDVTIGTLTPDMADLVAKDWPGRYVYKDRTLSFVRYLITTYPSVCVYDSKGAPVAYEQLQEYGGLGMLFVDPDHRKRGLGKLVTNLLIEKCIGLGLTPYVTIHPNNEASARLHVDLGFEKTDMFSEWTRVVRK